MARITVFGADLSPFVQKVVRALRMKKLDFETLEPKTPLDLRRWNPTTGKMPVIEIDGERTWDSTRIVRRLDELQPDPPLVAADPAVAARQRLLEDWADESLYWYVMALRWNPGHADATFEQILGDAVPSLAKPLVKRFVKRQLGGAPWYQGLGRLPEDVLLEEIDRLLDDLEAMREGREFYFADRPSVADLALYGELTMACSGPTPEIEACVARRPGLVEYLKRVEQATGG